MNEVKYPEVEVGLVGRDGNAFAILGAVSKALKRRCRVNGLASRCRSCLTGLALICGMPMLRISLN